MGFRNIRFVIIISIIGFFCTALLSCKSQNSTGSGKIYDKPFWNWQCSNCLGKVNTIDIYDNLMLVSDNELGLVIFNIDNPLNPKAITQISQGTVHDAVIFESYMYCAKKDTGLVIIDISDIENPFELKTIDIFDMIPELEIPETIMNACRLIIDGSRLYLLEADRGLYIFDIAQPDNPAPLGFFRLPQWVKGFDIKDDYIFIANYTTGLVVIDVSQPDEITAEDDVTVFATSQAFDVDVYQDYAYVADGNNGIIIADVSSPKNIRQAAHIQTISSVYDIVCRDNYLYAADNLGLRIFDISDPLNPVETGFLATDGSTRSIALKDNFAYTANSDFGIAIMDITSPESPYQASKINTSETTDLFFADNNIYLADGNNGIVVLGVEEPDNPTQVTRIDAYFAQNVFVEGNYLYAIDSRFGLMISDLSTITVPQIISYYRADLPTDIYVKGSMVYLANGSTGLSVVDVSDPDEPVNLVDYKAGYTNCIDIQDNYAYLGTRVGITYPELIIMDISDVFQLQIVSRIAFPGSIKDVKVFNDIAYVLHQPYISIVDISWKINPEIISQLNFEDPCGMTVDNNTLYVSDSENLLFYDLSDNRNPRKVKSLNTGGAGGNIIKQNNFLFISDKEMGLIIVPVPES